MTSEPTGGRGRRASDRGRYGRLSRERVLASALEVVDRDGLSGLSMRRLGAELGVEAMALYRYASGKDALLDGLVEAFCQELETELAGTQARPEAGPGGADPAAPPGLPDAAEAVEGAGAGEGAVASEGGGAREAAGGRGGEAGGEPGGGDHGAGRGAPAWQRELHRTARAAYEVALRHPNVVPLLATRLLSTPLARRAPAVLRTDERVLALLRDAGLDESRSVRVHRAFTAWLLGYLIVELRAMDDDPAEPEPAFRLGLHRLSADEFPRLRSTAPALAGRGGPAELDAGLDALLAALA
ncbi:TetR/AcrR family transcriptional regulator C-terminal domain-containing protein [Streptomyces sp. NPDC048566]|uniref:TetR/AcrR family transcriptional regulator C-terminal domain-containing protein n=1 Tax=Streptomyces sp. NPDC048566 TaxID=3365569 RepID=UPI00371899B1